LDTNSTVVVQSNLTFPSNGKKTIAAVFFILESNTTVGIADRIGKYKWMSIRYNLVLLTNEADFIKKKIPAATIIYVPYFRFPIVATYLFWLMCGIKLRSIKYDLLYLGFPESPISFFNFNRPFICLIYQSHEILWRLEKFKKKSIWNVLPRLSHKVYTNIVIKGIKNADYNVAVSTQLIDFFVKLGVDKTKMEYLPHGANLTLFSPDKQIDPHVDNIIPNNKFIMMYTGVINEKRGLDFLLIGTREIIKVVSDAILVIIGAEEHYTKTIKNKIKENNLMNDVIVMSHIDHALVPSYLKKAQVCLSFLELNATYSMSPPQKIFEYFAMGKPVIANRIPTHTDYIIDGVNGFIIDFNEKEFVKAIVQLHDNKALYEQMSKNAIKTSIEYDLEKINKKFGDIIDRFLQNSNIEGQKVIRKCKICHRPIRIGRKYCWKHRHRSQDESVRR